MTDTKECDASTGTICASLPHRGSRGKSNSAMWLERTLSSFGSFTVSGLFATILFNSGASSHFLLSTAPVLNKMVADRPLTVKLPNGDNVRSSHIAELDLPLLPRGGREAHIVPGLVSHSLVSVVQLCNAGCQVDVKDILCEIRYRGKTIVQCSKDVNTGLWMMPLTNGMETSTYATQQNDKENMRPNENSTINGAT